MNHSTPDDEMDLEYYQVGMERGVRGRFQQRIGHEVGIVFNEQQIDLLFADFKCQPYVIPDDRAPNSIIIKGAGGTRVLGEVRVPWVDQHDIELVVWDMDLGYDVRLGCGIGKNIPCSFFLI
jgi:hypothetical protein